MDALSDVLRSIRLSGGLFFRLELRAPFGVVAMGRDALYAEFANGAAHVLPFHLVTEGVIWCEVAGEPPARLDAGDLVVIPRGTTHALLDAPGRAPLPVERLAAHISGHPPTLRLGGGGQPASAMCGFFRSAGRLFNPLVEALPQVIVVRSDPTRRPWLTDTLAGLFTAEGLARPGTAALVERMTELLFVEVVQSQLRDTAPRGWLAGLADPLVARALGRIHAEPARDWTVEELGREVGASRTQLADRFRGTVGVSVIRYLTQWRMELAADRLVSTDRSVAEIAAEVGYQSEAALNRAFKRQVGAPPASWRRARVAT